MKQPDVAKYLRDALRAANDATLFIGEKTSDEYVASQILTAAVERKLMIVGEALWRADKLDSALSASISNLRRILGLRHRLVHGYEQIDSRAIYAIVRDDLPVLVRELEALLPGIESAPE